MAELLKGIELVKKDGSKVAAEKHLEGKLVALYFSAEWCLPCRAFTPKLKEFYEKIVGELGLNFEVVFVSQDKGEEELVGYFKEHHGDWVYIEFDSPEIEELLEKFEIKAIPTLRIVKADGTVIVAEAHSEVNAEEKGRIDPEVLFNTWKKSAEGGD
uniref:Thioredoxin domain-containing protein n=1 Tax=Plectus sambesii TaxID=2011161 RepID=A0A914UI93_9BILA